ncbi:MAG: response regulator [Verrucomicrobium sp.]|nr:response regulator [Verrucomicrobium sp.]
MTKQARILIVEDANIIALAMSYALEGAGFHVDLAGDGEQGVLKAREMVPDLILLDIMMPKMNGIEALKLLRADERTRDVPVIICSAKDFKTERQAAAELGALDYLIKPFNPAELVRKVSAALGSAQVAAPTLNGSHPATVVPIRYQPELDTKRTHYTFWGTRGSTPTVGHRFQRYGGNTSCMSYAIGDELLIFDAGSGIRELGNHILASGPRKLHLFITHTHWDHIQGFPFFTPAYLPGYDITVYGSTGFGKNLEALFRGQLDRDYFPVQMEDMRSNLRFQHLGDEPIEIGGAKITWEFSHHPLPTVGYKIEGQNQTVVWMPDDEFLQGYTGAPHALSRYHPQVAPFEKIVAFLNGVDVVVHEAQYMAEEYPNRVGWGHCSLPNACALMKLARAQRWIVTHHDPMHDDVFLDRKLCLTRQILEDIGHAIPVSHAFDGMTEFL